MTSFIAMPAKAYFVTGTDTEIGKTLAACALIHALRARTGGTVVGMKPVAAGIDVAGQNEDVVQLMAASNLACPTEWVAPFVLPEPLAPHLAAQRAGRSIDLTTIKTALNQLKAQSDHVVVEGVGGFRVPLNLDNGRCWDSADLAQALALPVILVVGLRLGCINHALLTAEAIQHSGLPLAGWIANRIDPAMSLPEESLKTLVQLIPAPLLGEIPWQHDGRDAQLASQSLDLSQLV